MVAGVFRFGQPAAGNYRAAGSVPSQPDPDWLEAAKKGGSGSKATWRGALTQVLDPVQKRSTDGNPIESLANSQGFRAAGTATQKELLSAMSRRAGDAVFSHGLQELASNPAFANLTLAQQRDAIQTFDRVASGAAYRAVSDAGRQQILSNLTNIVTSSRYQTAFPVARRAIADALDVTGVGTIPIVPQYAPERIDLSALQRDFDAQWSNSFPGGRSLEQGGTLVSNNLGNVSMIHPGGVPGESKRDSFRADLSTDPDQKLLGVFHTHPYDSTEGGHTGVSMTGGDAASLINNHAWNVIIAQSGNEQFMYLRTGITRNYVDGKAVKDLRDQRVRQLMEQGLSLSYASKIAAKETAQTYGLAYYEGTNGVFTRVYP
jgi:hypothetical protein